jgi:hypothetical protein
VSLVDLQLFDLQGALLHNVRGSITGDMVTKELDYRLQVEFRKHGLAPDLYYVPADVEMRMDGDRTVFSKAARPHYNTVWIEDIRFSFDDMDIADALLPGVVQDMWLSGFQATHLLLRYGHYTRFVQESRRVEIATGEVRALGMRVLGGYPMNRIIGVSERYRIWT